MTNKLVVIINSLKVPKIKILLYEIKFIVLKLQLPPEPLTMGLPPPDPCPLSSTEFVDPPPLKKKSWVCHWFLYPLDGLLYMDFGIINK